MALRRLSSALDLVIRVGDGSQIAMAGDSQEGGAQIRDQDVEGLGMETTVEMM